MIYQIGNLYQYPGSNKKFELSEVSSRGLFYFTCGHWCTDNVFIDLLDDKTGIRVGDTVQTSLNLCFELKPNKNTCKQCQYIEAWECGSKTIFYCKIVKSNRTQNGQLKIKCKTPACKHFKLKA